MREKGFILLVAGIGALIGTYFLGLGCSFFGYFISHLYAFCFFALACIYGTLGYFMGWKKGALLILIGVASAGFVGFILSCFLPLLSLGFGPGILTLISMAFIYFGAALAAGYSSEEEENASHITLLERLADGFDHAGMFLFAGSVVGFLVLSVTIGGSPGNVMPIVVVIAIWGLVFNFVIGPIFVLCVDMFNKYK